MLEEYGASATVIDVYVSAYEKNLDELRRHLLTSGFSFPQVVGVDWRLDYYLKSNSVEAINKPMYIISLKTEKMDSRRLGAADTSDVQFSCSIEELQDLVDRLKDATKQAERITRETK